MTDQPTTNQATNRPTGPVDGRGANRYSAVFYAVVALVALAGQTDAAVGWLHWPVATALPAVGALELGGIALAARADWRRRLGERAVAARTLSAVVACFAVAFNWLGHTNHLAGGFFAGMSALGYCVWLIQAGDRRRDQLRAAGMLPDVPPTYPLAQWVRHPWLTRRARALAIADRSLDLHTSFTAAALAVRVERRQAAIATILHRQIKASADPASAEMAVTVFDLDEIARRLVDRANYDGLTDLVAAGLDPDRLLRPADQPATTPTDQPPPVGDAEANQPTAPAPNQPARRPPTGRTPNRAVAAPTDQPPRLRLVGHSAAAVDNAAHLRTLYGDQLPESGRQIREKTGWSHVRTVAAVEAYNAGADLPGDDDQEREPALTTATA